MTTSLPLLDDEANDTRGFGGLVGEHGALPLVGLDVRTRIADLVAHATVVQTFVNSADDAVEVTYTFPLPDRAAVTSFTMHVADRLVRGQLKERGEARRAYDAAIRDGKRAAISEEERGGVFTLRVGNLLPGEVARISLELVSLLPVDDGEVTWRFPLVVAPRYTPGRPLDGTSVGSGTAVDTDVVRDASRVSPPVLLPGATTPVALSIAVEFARGGLPITHLRASLHSVVVENGPAQPTRVVLEPGARLDRDFIVRFRVADELAMRQSLRVVRDDVGDGATFMLTVAPPALPTEEHRPRDVVFLLDRSGSMAGWKMTAARRALAAMVGSLVEGDCFRVFGFADGLETHGDAFKPDLVAASATTRREAAAFLNGLQAGGGTELRAPLELALDLVGGGYADREHIVVLVTDGQITNEADVLQALEGRLKNARVLAVGIDVAVNGAFLTRLATTSGGLCELVESEERLDDVMERIHARLRAPLLSELALRVSGVDVDAGSIVPARLPPLFHGLPLTVLGRCRVDGRAEATRPRATVTGARTSGGSVTLEVDGVVAAEAGVRAAWARGRLRDLEDLFDRGRGDIIALREELRETSLREGVLCRFTSFVAVDERQTPLPKSAKPRQVVQPVSAPASSPQDSTATTTIEQAGPRQASHLGGLLTRKSLITVAQLQEAQEAQKQRGGRLGTHLVELGHVAAGQLTELLSRQYGVPAIHLAEFEIDPDVIRLVPREVAEKYAVVPVNRAGGSLIIAMSDPTDLFAIDDIRFVTGYTIEVVVAADSDIREAILKYFDNAADGDRPAAANLEDILGDFEDDVDIAENVRDDDDDELIDDDDGLVDGVTVPIAVMVNRILVDAMRRQASAVHLAIEGGVFVVWARVAGAWIEVMRRPRAEFPKILSRLVDKAGSAPGMFRVCHGGQDQRFMLLLLRDGEAMLTFL
jgi:Ca-activated chloride channel family protein